MSIQKFDFRSRKMFKQYSRNTNNPGVGYQLTL